MPNDVRSTTGGEIDNENPPFFVQSLQPAVEFDFEEADPPHGDYVTVPDVLVIWAVALGGGSSFRVNLRILREDGVIVPFACTALGNVSPTISPQTFNLPEGYILSGSVIAVAGTGVGAPMYAHVGLRRSPNTSADTYHTLFQGQIFVNVPCPFNSNLLRLPADGNGVIGTTNVSAPAAGADLTFSVPGGTRMRILSFSASLATSAAVAARLPALVFDDGANVLAIQPGGFSEAASLNVSYTWGDSLQFNSTDPIRVSAPSVGNALLGGGFRVRTLTDGIQAADQWTAARMLTQTWIDLG